jgi:AcrR family transcriptional regulator
MLHMRTVPGDLATPARIRHAAIALFGREGFGVGLRAIADEAGADARFAG